jgi:hypothetical protein
MLESLLNTLFGCSHNRITFPITPGRRPAGSRAHRHGTYVVCLDCGQEFRYDWSQMRLGEQVSERPYRVTAESFSPANQ